MLHGVYHVHGMAKSLLFVCQVTGLGRYVLFEPIDVKISDNIKVEGTAMMIGRKVQSMYVMLPD